MTLLLVSNMGILIDLLRNQCLLMFGGMYMYALDNFDA